MAERNTGARVYLTVIGLMLALAEAQQRVEEAEADCVVVGLPLSLDGSVGPAAEKALAEVERLGAVLGVPVETYDERLTTVTAERVLREQGVTGRRRRQVVDQVAPSVLLQAWLDARSTASVEDDDGHP